MNFGYLVIWLRIEVDPKFSVVIMLKNRSAYIQINTEFMAHMPSCRGLYCGMFHSRRTCLAASRQKRFFSSFYKASGYLIC